MEHSTVRTTKYLFINTRDEMLRLDVERIVFFHANGNYTDIHCANKLKYTINMSLLRLQSLLAISLSQANGSFVRVGKSYIINTNYITHISVPRQRLMMSDLSFFEIELNVAKDALKSLKMMLTTPSGKTTNGRLSNTNKTDKGI